MFVKIKKGEKVLTVPKTSFLNFFADQGWEEVKSSSHSGKEKKNEEVKEEELKDESVEEETEETTEEVKDEWDEAMEEDEADIEKPISEMTKDELIAYADQNGIDISGLTKTSQIKEAIKNANK